jgi:hypothetical protein
MPGFDGTGPRGRGPMTGNAGGYCLLKISDIAGEPRTGFAGLAGKPVTISNDSRQTDIALLQDRLRGIQSALQELKWRLANLAAGGCTVLPPTSATDDSTSSGQAEGSYS